MLAVIVDILCDIPYILMTFVLVASVYMGVIAIRRICRLSKQRGKFTGAAVKEIILDCFKTLFLVHIPWLVLEVLITALNILNIWRIKYLFKHWSNIRQNGQGVADLYTVLCTEIQWFLGDVIHLPLLVLSFGQIWRLSTLIRIYSVIV